MGAFLVYLVDTNILIYHFNNSIPESERPKIKEIFQEHFNISIITKIEFLGFKQHNEESFEKAKAFIKYATIFPLTDEIADKAINLRRASAVKLADAIIAATTKIHNFTLVTRNTEDFKNIEVLKYNPFFTGVQ
jgi:predicted nucleic acid-binding protein